MKQTNASDERSGFSAANFAVADEAIEAILNRHNRKDFSVQDPAWQEEVAKAISKRRLGFRRWLRRVLLKGRNAREQTEVQSGYETHWHQLAKVEDYIAGLNQRTLAVQWRQRGMIVAPQVLRQSHLLYLMRAIEAVQPRSVLEVGCGNGNMVLTLAARFPEVSFNGIELTVAGVAAAQAVQAQAELPQSFVDNSPEPLLDLTAHRRVILKTGTAAELPFADRSIDLVYTRLALEQMEQLRHQALREVTRVANTAIVLIEPWRDYNLTDPGRAYIRRTGYFRGRIDHLRKYGFAPILETQDLPQKVQFNAGPVVALRQR